MLGSLLTFFIPDAYADSITAPPAQQGGFTFVAMFAIFFLFLYFAVWRPQNKRAREQENMLTSLAKGDEVVTAGGLLGRITKLTDSYLTLSVGNQTEIVMQKSSVVSVLPKGTLKTLE